MKLKLDENVPHRAGEFLASAGYDVATVAGEGLAGATDAVVLAVAAREDRLLITLDRGLGDVRLHPPGSHAGVVVLRLQDQGALNAMRVLRRLEEETGLAALAGCVAVVSEWLTRIRYPNPSDP